MTYLVDGIHVRVHPSKATAGRYIVLAKREPFVLPDNAKFGGIGEPGEMWFECGTDQAAMIDSLVAELKAAAQ